MITLILMAHKESFTKTKYFLGAILLLTLCSTLSIAQSGYGETPLGNAPGSPVGSYALSDIDNVNLFNGHVNIHIPLLSAGGRYLRLRLAGFERSVQNGQWASSYRHE